LSRIEDFAFADTSLKRIAIPSSVLMLADLCFASCKDLENVALDPDSKLDRIGESAFNASSQPYQSRDCCQTLLCWSSARPRYRYVGDRLTSIQIPSSISVLAFACFFRRLALESVTFLPPSQLVRLESSAFHYTGLKSICILASVTVICDSSFRCCPCLNSVTISRHFQLPCS
jgi:hypothetical protein